MKIPQSLGQVQPASLCFCVTGIVSRHSMSTNSEPCLGRTGSSFLARRYTRGLRSALLSSFIFIPLAGLLCPDLEGRLGVYVSGLSKKWAREAHVEDACPRSLPTPRCSCRGPGGLHRAPWSGKFLRYICTIWAFLTELAGASFLNLYEEVLG